LPDEAPTVAIVFADICDSTPLYEANGDARALAIVASRLDELATIARDHGGRVIRSKGDDVLCTFDDPCAALDASAAMADAHGHGVAAIHVGIHFGPVIYARDDVFGDAVNVAARVLGLAKPGEILASEDLVTELGAADRARMSALGSRDLKGRNEPLSIYSMVLDEGDKTQIVWGSGVPRPEHPRTAVVAAMVDLEHAGRKVRVFDGERCLIGRASRCDLTIDSRAVSREHAWVAASGGRVTVTDRSSTGTWVIDPEGRHTTLRRDTVAIKGRGRLRLGRHPRDAEPAVEVEFTVGLEE